MPFPRKDSSLLVKDIARILSIATKGVKATSASVSELERLVAIVEKN